MILAPILFPALWGPRSRNCSQIALYISLNLRTTFLWTVKLLIVFTLSPSPHSLLSTHLHCLVCLPITALSPSTCVFKCWYILYCMCISIIFFVGKEGMGCFLFFFLLHIMPFPHTFFIIHAGSWMTHFSPNAVYSRRYWMVTHDLFLIMFCTVSCEPQCCCTY